MQEPIELSSIEILHVIGVLGKDDFFGINDGFADMDEIEIKIAISKAENALIEKGYAELDFDGNFSIDERVSNILLTCADCDSFLDIQITNIVGKNIKKTVYYKDDKLVVFDDSGKDSFHISYSDITSIKNHILSNINWINDKNRVVNKIFFTQRVLSEAKSSVGFGSEEMLFRECNNHEIAKVISNGLNGNSNYYAFTSFFFSEKSTDINSIIVLNSTDGSLELVSEDDEQTDAITFKPTDYDTVTEKILNMLSKFENEVRFN